LCYVPQWIRLVVCFNIRCVVKRCKHRHCFLDTLRMLDAQRNCPLSQ
jgi:hypothetical protein